MVLSFKNNPRHQQYNRRYLEGLFQSREKPSLGLISTKPDQRTVNVSLQNIQAEKEALTDGREKTPKYHRTEDGFIRIGE